MDPPLMAKNSVPFLQVLASDTPTHHQTTHGVMASLKGKSKLMEKAISLGRSLQEALTGLRAQPLGDGLPLTAEILHGRSLVTRKARSIDLTAVCQSLIVLQAKYTKSHDKAKQAKDQQALVIGEEVYFFSGKNE